MCSPTVRRNDVGQSMVEHAILIPSTRFSSCRVVCSWSVGTDEHGIPTMELVTI